jgi:hypothetical protein
MKITINESIHTFIQETKEKRSCELLKIYITYKNTDQTIDNALSVHPTFFRYFLCEDAQNRCQLIQQQTK